MEALLSQLADMAENQRMLYATITFVIVIGFSFSFSKLVDVLGSLWSRGHNADTPNGADE